MFIFVLIGILAFEPVTAYSPQDAGVPGSCIDGGVSSSGFVACWPRRSPSCSKALYYNYDQLAPHPPIEIPVIFGDTAVEFLVGLSVYASKGGSISGSARVSSLFESFVTRTPASSQLLFLIHASQDTYRELLEMKLNFKKNETINILNPPAAYQALLRKYLPLPEYIGIGLMSDVTSQPELFGFTQNLTQWYLEAFFNYLWSHNNVELPQRRVMYKVMAPGHEEYVVGTFRHVNCPAYLPFIKPVRYNGYYFSHYTAVDASRLQYISDFFSMQVGVTLSAAEFRASFDESYQHLVNTLVDGMPNPEPQMSSADTDSRAGTILLMVAGALILAATALIVVVIAMRSSKQRHLTRAVDDIKREQAITERRMQGMDADLQTISSSVHTAQSRVDTLDSTVKALSDAVTQQFVGLYNHIGLNRNETARSLAPMMHLNDAVHGGNGSADTSSTNSGSSTPHDHQRLLRGPRPDHIASSSFSHYVPPLYPSDSTSSSTLLRGAQSVDAEAARRPIADRFSLSHLFGGQPTLPPASARFDAPLRSSEKYATGSTSRTSGRNPYHDLL